MKGIERVLSAWVLLCALVLLGGLPASAQQSLEVVPLRHRSAEQVIPVLRPLVAPGGVISGQGYQLILRTSPGNLRELKDALAAIDTAQRQLQISVRYGADGERERAGFEVRGSSRGAIELRSSDLRSTQSERVDQRIRVLEGARAFIATGESRPQRETSVISGPRGAVVSESTSIQQLATGFEVLPRVSGDRVSLDIYQRRDRPGAPGGAAVQTQQAASTLSARLGEWIELGGSSEGGTHSERGVLSSSDARGSQDRRVWVKVEELLR